MATCIDCGCEFPSQGLLDRHREDGHAPEPRAIPPMTVEHDGRTYRIEVKQTGVLDSWIASIDGERVHGPSPIAGSRSQAAALQLALDHILIPDPAPDEEIGF